MSGRMSPTRARFRRNGYHCRRRVVLMYFDRRLWILTRGLRGWIALAVLLGLIAAVVGIARFAILGVLLSRVFDGAGLLSVAIPAVSVAAAVILRGFIDHHRAMISHRTATRVQEELRGRL